MLRINGFLFEVYEELSKKANETNMLREQFAGHILHFYTERI